MSLRSHSPSTTLAQEVDASADEPSNVPSEEEPAQVEDNNETPKSPWTPSYTVTQQGAATLSVPAVEEQEPNLPVDEEGAPTEPADPEAPAKEVVSVAAQSLEVVPNAAETPEITVESVDKETEGINGAVEQPGRPWTPSYSVTQQGTVSPQSEQPEQVNEDSPQVFPSTETAESHKVAQRPGSLRLATVSETEKVDVTSPSGMDTLSPTDATSHRSRQESTASSRFFPGGWFNSPKSPDDNRASLDHANGEFAKLTSNSIDTPSPILEVPTNTPIDGIDERKNKSRWCVIM